MASSTCWQWTPNNSSVSNNRCDGNLLQVTARDWWHSHLYALQNIGNGEWPLKLEIKQWQILTLCSCRLCCHLSVSVTPKPAYALETETRRHSATSQAISTHFRSPAAMVARSNITRSRLMTKQAGQRPTFCTIKDKSKADDQFKVKAWHTIT